MLYVGQNDSMKRVFTEQDLEMFRELTGSSVSVSDDGADIVPSMLLMGLVSNLLGTKLPGRGTNWLKQRMEFPSKAKTGEEINAEITIVTIREDKALVNLHTKCTVPDGRVVCNADSLVLVKDLES